MAEHSFQRSNLLGFKEIMGMTALEASHTLPTVVFPSSPFSPVLISYHVVITNIPVNRMTDKYINVCCRPKHNSLKEKWGQSIPGTTSLTSV
jgi:hypothetical protein